MKPIFIIVLLSFFSFSLQAQDDDGNALKEAIERNSITSLEALFKKGVSPTATYGGSRKNLRGRIKFFRVSPFGRLVNRGCENVENRKKMISLFIEYGLDINATIISWLPIEEAARSGCLPIVEHLLAKNATVTDYAIEIAFRDKDLKMAKTMLRHSGAYSKGLKPAIEDKDLEMLKYLVENGADVNYELTIFEAIESNDPAIVKYILSQHPDLTKVNRMGRTPQEEAQQGTNSAIIELFGTPKEDPKVLAAKLYEAVEKNNLNEVIQVLNAGADPNQKLGYSKPPLSVAVEEQYYSIAEQLLKSGAGPNKSNVSFRPNLAKAAENCDQQMFLLLVKYGASIPEAQSDLLDHSEKCTLPFFQFLKQQGVDFSKADITDFMKTDPAIYSFLKANNTDLDKVDFTGEGLLHKYAIHDFYMANLKKLIALGANVDLKDKKGRTPLHIAAQWGNLEVVKVLIQAGATVNARDSRNLTPLKYVRTHHKTTYNYLKAKGGIE